MAQDVEVRQGWFVPIPACPLSVHRYVFTFSSPPQSITSESGQESQGFYLQDIRCHKLLLESASRQINREWRANMERELHCGTKRAQ